MNYKNFLAMGLVSTFLVLGAVTPIPSQAASTVATNLAIQSSLNASQIAIKNNKSESYSKHEKFIILGTTLLAVLGSIGFVAAHETNLFDKIRKRKIKKQISDTRNKTFNDKEDSKHKPQ